MDDQTPQDTLPAVAPAVLIGPEGPIPRNGAAATQLALSLGATLAPTALSFDDGPVDYETWQTIGRAIGFVENATRWWVADWMNLGEQMFGEEAAQAADDLESRFDIAKRITGLEGSTLNNMRSIANRVPAENRREELPFHVHAVVMALEPEEQQVWLERAVDAHWSRSEFREAIASERRGGTSAPPQPVEGGDGMTADQRLKQRVRLVVSQAEIAQDGSAIVPAEAWAQLVSALGEE